MDTSGAFSKDSIDLVRTYKNFRAKYPLKPGRKRGSACGYCFGADVIRMAEAVIGKHFCSDELMGVKSCIAYQIRQVEGIRYVPFIKSKSKMFGYFGGTSPVSLLTDSVILTTIAYRMELSETSTGLAHIVFNEMILGFEWVCWWKEHGVRINPAENELIETFDLEKVTGYIRASDTRKN